MKRFLIPAFVLCLLLCSCEYEYPDDTRYGVQTTAEEVTEEPVDTEILSHLSEFTSIYDEVLDAEWITYGDRSSGFFTRIVYYTDKDASLRLFCTEADKFTHGGVSYAIPDGDTGINDKTLVILSEIADGGDCIFGGRDITEKEREALKNTILLYKASSYIRKADYIDAAGIGTDEDGNSVFENAEYVIKFPSSFSPSFDGEKLTVISGTRRLRAVSVVRSDKAFSTNIADKDAVIQSIGEDAVLLTEIEELRVGGAEAYRFAYEKNGLYVIQYFVDGNGKTYILTGASYDGNDRIPANIISTFKIK